MFGRCTDFSYRARREAPPTLPRKPQKCFWKPENVRKVRTNTAESSQSPHREATMAALGANFGNFPLSCLPPSYRRRQSAFLMMPSLAPSGGKVPEVRTCDTLKDIAAYAPIPNAICLYVNLLTPSCPTRKSLICDLSGSRPEIRDSQRVSKPWIISRLSFRVGHDTLFFAPKPPFSDPKSVCRVVSVSVLTEQSQRGELTKSACGLGKDTLEVHHRQHVRAC